METQEAEKRSNGRGYYLATGRLTTLALGRHESSNSIDVPPLHIREASHLEVREQSPSVTQPIVDCGGRKTLDVLQMIRIPLQQQIYLRIVSLLNRVVAHHIQ